MFSAGIVGVIWCVVWWFVVKDKPMEDPYISPDELKYIQESLGTGGPAKPVSTLNKFF